MTATTASENSPKAKTKRTAAKKKSALAKSVEKKTKIQTKSALVEDKRKGKSRKTAGTSPGSHSSRNNRKATPIKVTLGRTKRAATGEEPAKGKKGTRKPEGKTNSDSPFL